jgi:diaminopimelate epimerase
MASGSIASVPFVKAHALGNDFLLARTEALPAGDHAGLARRVCHRHHGIGADGMMTVRRQGGDVTTRLWNADGSRSELSGNGVRCVAAWLAQERGLEPGQSVGVGTDAGPKTLELIEATGGRLTFRAAMGRPEDLRKVTLDVEGDALEVVVLRVGNPQCVLLGPATTDRLETLGRALATHPFFPEGTNVELAAVDAPDRVRVLIWERGVGPTTASGTGSCAAAVAAATFGDAECTVDVASPGGTQRVEWTEQGLWLTGWAELVGAVEWWGG